MEASSRQQRAGETQKTRQKKTPINAENQSSFAAAGPDGSSRLPQLCWGNNKADESGSACTAL